MKRILMVSICALSFLHAQESLTVETVAADQKLWPREVTINTPHKMPIIVNGKQAGSAQAPGGRVYPLKAVAADGSVTVDAMGAPLVFPAADTDILIRSAEAQARLATATAATPLPTPVAQATPRPAAATPTPPVLGSIAQGLAGDLIALKGKKIEKYDEVGLAGKKYLAIYFSASWCPPCRGFTPELVSWYKRKKSQQEKFELIFVSNDRSQEAMESYLKEDNMPWPALAYDKASKRNPLSKFGGRGIPCLVIIDPDGQVIAHSYVNGEYVGPRQVLKEFEKLLRDS